MEPNDTNELVSCLTVTQPGRFALLALAANDFARQTYGPRELVILHDGDAAWDRQCRALADVEQERCCRPITVHQMPPGQTLGELRNAAVARASGAWVCQWDDDDRYHPERLARQHANARQNGADVVFLTTQMHWFQDTGELIFEDWSREPYPGNVVQGSLLARRKSMPLYPPLRRGEDTALLATLVAQQAHISRVRGMPWLYAYQYHGQNTWDAAHHRAGALAKSFSPAAVRNVESAVRSQWPMFHPPLPSVRKVVHATLPLAVAGVQALAGVGAVAEVAHTIPGCGAFAITGALADTTIASHIRTGDAWEHEVVQLMLALLRPGDTTVDVGANLGYFTLLMSRRVGSLGRVIAVEPEPRNLVLLAHNVARNDCRNVHILGVAASDVGGRGVLALNEVNWGDHRLDANDAERRTVDVELARLDDMLPADRVDCLKIDVQGAEVLVLRGAAALVERSRDTLVVISEYEPRTLPGGEAGIALLTQTLETLGARISLLEWTGQHPRLSVLTAVRSALTGLAALDGISTELRTFTIVLTFSAAAQERLQVQILARGGEVVPISV